MADTELKPGDEGFVGDAPHDTGNAKPPEEIRNIGERMSESAQGQVRKDEDPNPQNAPVFDFSKLTLEQLQGLKAQLASVPERVSGKHKNPITLLREVNGDVVTEFSNSYMAVVRDIEQQRDMEMPMIRIKTRKNPEWTQMKYKDFMLLPQVKCEIVKHLQEADRKVEGEVWSKERQSFVELEVKLVKHTFVVKLPDGEEISIDSAMSNA